MCGVAGFLQCHDTYDFENDLKNAVNSIQHRGPDSSGIWNPNNSVGLGHRRLSILDLSELGHQPMNSKNGRYTIVFNGEIYNFIELRKKLISFGYKFISNCDSEVILAAFE